MKKLLVLLAILPLAAGCASLQFSNPFKANTLYEIESGSGIVLAGIDGYFALRQCKKSEVVTPTNICARRSVKLQLQSAVKGYKLALDNARAFVKNNPTIDPISVITEVRAALAVVQQIATENNVRIGG